MIAQVTCSNCSAVLRSKTELAGKRVKCPKCQSFVEIAKPQPAESNETPSELANVPAGRRLNARASDQNEVEGESSVYRWLILATAVLISLAAGTAGGFVFGHSQGKSNDRRELAEIQSQAQSQSEKLTSTIATLQTERDNLKLESANALQDREAKIALTEQKVEVAINRARTAEKLYREILTTHDMLLASNDAQEAAAQKQREEERQKAEAWKKVETVKVNTVKEALTIHENPRNYVGKKVVVSKDIAFIIGDNFDRNAESDGYLFTWECGATASAAERFGNSLGFFDGKLNYWCDTDSGLLAKEKLKAERKGDNIIYHRMGLTFNIKTKKIKEFGREREYYVAELTGIEPK